MQPEIKNIDAREGVDVAGALEERTRIETDREFTAHVYQNLIDLQPYLAGDSKIAVMVRRSSPEMDVEIDDAAASGASNFLVTLSATVGEARIEAHGQDADIYVAFDEAKELMVEHMSEWSESAQDPRERDLRILAYTNATGVGANMIH